MADSILPGSPSQNSMVPLLGHTGWKTSAGFLWQTQDAVFLGIYRGRFDIKV